jgi:hypothetical protein
MIKISSRNATSDIAFIGIIKTGFLYFIFMTIFKILTKYYKLK